MELRFIEVLEFGVALFMDVTLFSTGSGLALWLLESGCRWLFRW